MQANTYIPSVQVDLVDFSGPDYYHVDKRCVALRLVEKRLCDAALFNPSGPLVLSRRTCMCLRNPFDIIHIE